MQRKTLAKVAKSTIMIKKEMPIRKKSIPKYHQNYDNDESKDSNEKEKRRPKKKETKYHFETIIRGVYYQNCYNEGHLANECNLLNKFC